MTRPELSNAGLHYAIIRHVIDHGYGPTTRELAALFETTEEAVDEGLHTLAENHGVVLHPNRSSIWVIHPFSMAPTTFLVRCRSKTWWGNCAWCSLGIAALMQDDTTITTTLGAEGKQVEVHVRDGQVLETDLYVHFPIPMRDAWDNVIYTCSTMLLFESEEQVERWAHRHRIPRGDVQPIAKIWAFAQAWYGNHLSPDWKKWTVEEAVQLFKQFGLTGDTWDLPQRDTRF